MNLLMLFVVAADDMDRNEIHAAIRAAIRSELSPRFMPDRIIHVTAIPRTLSSKKLELPIKRLFEGGSQVDWERPITAVSVAVP